MTELQLRTQCDKGIGSIEFLPVPDQNTREAIHQLGILGISNIIEHKVGGVESMAFVFDHTEANNIDETAILLAQELQKDGIAITISNEDIAEEPKHIQRTHRLAHAFKRLRLA